MTKKTKLETFAEAAEELNEVLGLEPSIETEGVSVNELAEKIRQASELLYEEDEISDATAAVIADLTEDLDEPDVEEPESDDDFEEDDESEEESEEEELTLEDLREEVEGLHKRKDMRLLVEEIDLFEPLIEKLPDLKSGSALKDAMLEILDAEMGQTDGSDEPEEVQEEPEAEEAKPVKEKPKKVKKEKPKKVEEKQGKKKGRGVIATIAQSIEDAGKKGITKEEILGILTKAFPNREPESMKKTINVQVPNRISKERFNVERSEDGRYFKS